VAILAAMLLSSCCTSPEPELPWQDATNQGRSNADAKKDADDCFNRYMAEYLRQKREGSPQFIFEKSKQCMEARGWRFVGHLPADVHQ
jgi:hypothetical protein